MKIRRDFYLISTINYKFALAAFFSKRKRLLKNFSVGAIYSANVLTTSFIMDEKKEMFYQNSLSKAAFAYLYKFFCKKFLET